LIDIEFDYPKNHFVCFPEKRYSHTKCQFVFAADMTADRIGICSANFQGHRDSFDRIQEAEAQVLVPITRGVPVPVS